MFAAHMVATTSNDDARYARLASDFGKQLRRARGRTSQDDLAEASAVDQAAISLFERGQRLPTLDQIMRLEAALGLKRGGLLHHVYCDIGTSGQTTLVIEIKNATDLDPIAREALLRVYEGLRRVGEDKPARTRRRR